MVLSFSELEYEKDWSRVNKSVNLAFSSFCKNALRETDFLIIIINPSIPLPPCCSSGEVTEIRKFLGRMLLYFILTGVCWSPRERETRPTRHQEVARSREGTREQFAETRVVFHDRPKITIRCLWGERERERERDFFYLRTYIHKHTKKEVASKFILA